MLHNVFWRKSLPIMLALCSMLWHAYYASIIGASLTTSHGRVSGKAGHGQDADANLDTDLNISFCGADTFW